MDDFLFIVFIIVMVTLFGVMIYAGVHECSKTVVETYTVGCEISQLAYAEETTGRSSSRPAYKMGVRNDNFATTFDITAEQFAMYVIGDVVEVEVTVYEYKDGTIKNEYRLK